MLEGKILYADTIHNFFFRLMKIDAVDPSLKLLKEIQKKHDFFSEELIKTFVNELVKTQPPELATNVLKKLSEGKI